MPLSDLSEIADAANLIVERHSVLQRRSSKHIISAVWVFVGCFIVWAGISVYIAKIGNDRIGLPQAALASINVSAPVTNPILCPGDVLHYALTIVVSKPLVGKSIVMVRNLDTMFPELSSSSDSIYDTPGTVKIGTDWVIPATLPATATRPERLWAPGQYRRSFAISTANSNTETPISHVDFRIGTNCEG